MPRAKAHLCHFLGKPPSILQILDDPTIEHDELVEATALQLAPREVDRGKTSYWEIALEADERQVSAGFAARRKSRQALGVFRLRPEIAEAAGVTIENDRDPDMFDCVADLHRLLHLDSEEVRIRLVRHLLNAMQRREIEQDFVYYKLSKGKVSELVRSIYQECIKAGATVELEKAADWARQLAREMKE